MAIKAVTLIACGPMGCYQKHIFLHEFQKHNVISFTEGRARKPNRRTLEQRFLLLEGHVNLDYPKGYVEKPSGTPGITVQESKYCMFDSRYEDEYRAWAKALDRTGLVVIAEG